MDLGLNGRAALVLGSTSGLGRAVGEALAGEGARVAFCGRRAALARETAAAHEEAVGIETDLTDADSVRAALASAERELGPVDVLVLNSGGPPPGRAEDLTAEALTAAFTSMLLRQVELVNAVLPGMRARGWGRIVGIGSSGVQAPIPGLALSNTLRGGLAGYLKTLAGEVAGDGVTVNMVLPGRIDTDRVASLDRAAADRQRLDVDVVRERSQALIPVGRYGRPEEFAAAVTFLCGNPASYITGEQLRCDGGLVAGY
ncbi:SDR family oxidoreductase [Actinophytocola gossypii]|uniref:SDR family oxidoreductase n=1 Tax=Actinophytocola gossypii TaxID=2812003 RepID=A0ABT2J1V8_9PSEU|nr:SDR family oxidoreductase [Actinophytocola gossypii]MCT2581843.1 SDR family oxidoreductase [Actinophytocola gossypii]